MGHTWVQRVQIALYDTIEGGDTKMTDFKRNYVLMRTGMRLHPIFICLPLYLVHCSYTGSSFVHSSIGVNLFDKGSEAIMYMKYCPEV